MATLRMTHGRSLQDKAATGHHALRNPNNTSALMKSAVHTRQGHDETAPAPQQVTAKVSKHVVVPVEENVKVPVVRKEVRTTMVKNTIKCQRLVPVTRYKEVEETTLETRHETVNGKREKRAAPITQKRMQPYQDFVEEEYEVEVEVPKQEVVTRTGYRTDKHVTSQVVEVEQEHIYEMRPVLVGKGEVRYKNLGDHHKFKHEHGQPQWDAEVTQGWLGKPKTPEYKPHLHRPRSSSSVLGSKFDQEKKLLHATATGRPKSPAGFRSMSQTRLGRSY